MFANELSGKIPREVGNLLELVSLDLSGDNLSGEISWRLGNLHALEFLDFSTNHISGTIPSSLSQLNWLAVLNLSHNNLSRKIPLGTQLQSFDASAYDENPYLCGSQLKRLCSDEKGSKAPCIEEEEDDSFISQGFYISMGLGFVTGFWAIFGSLLIFPSWRHAYFTFLSNLYERIVVVTLINLARCHRRYLEAKWVKRALEAGRGALWWWEICQSQFGVEADTASHHRNNKSKHLSCGYLR
ncbi:hypothetical protein K1719_044154 [Acacia pycnantha]|nr:hypothetical protein K1719_044154 [Acacia pycnantha]